MRSRTPSGTYRLQFNSGFTFEQARQLVPYLHALGVSHIYASPFFCSSPGSTHGYDLSDHNQFNSEIGSREDFNALDAELKRARMGLIADFVSNHMGINETQNLWWMDVLENGPASPYAAYFDIDWHPLKSELRNKVLLPILAEQYGRVLEGGEFKLQFEHGKFFLLYQQYRLPLSPRSTRPLLQACYEQLRAPPAELASILTALDHLPTSLETAPEKLEERKREKEIISQRLERLASEEPLVEESIKRAMLALEDSNDPASFDQLDALIEAQRYRLSSWRVAAEEINYRRFFDVNSLAAIRMENPEVFTAVHRLLFELIDSGAINGIRIDHIDGLANPLQYLSLLQERARALGPSPWWPRSLPVWVEKILAPGERLRAEWPIEGTTGYEFATQVMAILLDAKAASHLSHIYERFTGSATSFEQEVYQSKLLVMRVAMASEVNSLGCLLNRISESHRWYRDFTVNALTTAVREVIACFPVYRTYLVPGEPPSASDVRILQRALTKARRRNPALEHSVFEFLRDVLVPPPFEHNPHPVDEELRRCFVIKFQQCTGPIAAKGVEDTAFYRYHRLIALNEVGGDPGQFGGSVETFHRQNASRGSEFPNSLLATSTHDTKRSEDVRARILSLSEHVHEWGREVRRWRTANRKYKISIEGESAPDANEEFLLYQTLLGSWPLEAMNPSARALYVSRIQAYMIKALHEAKVNSSWVEPHQVWDEAVCTFISKILEPDLKNRFLPDFEVVAEQVARTGAINALSQTVLKLTVPGIPDLYQGSELWDLSLVDPDNRRPVDFQLRERHLEALEAHPSPALLLKQWRTGRIKFFVIQKLLRYRRDHPDLFSESNYVAVSCEGTFAQCLVAFERQKAEGALLVIVPRLSSLVGFPPVGIRWADSVVLPNRCGGSWVDLFTNQVHAANVRLPVAELFSQLPFSVLVHHNG